jgi:hypothetical protein
MDTVTTALLEFGKEHLQMLVVATVYYFAAGLIGAVLGRKSRIDEWCDSNPGLAIVLNFLRGTGFDFWKVLTQLQVLFKSKSTFGGGGLPALLLIGAMAAGTVTVGCNRSALHVKVQQALVFEDQVHAQVTRIESALEANIPLLPPTMQEKARAEFAAAKDKIAIALSSKDQALQAALAASADTVDVTALVANVILAVESAADLVGKFGVPKGVVEEHKAQARTLSRGL